MGLTYYLYLKNFNKFEDHSQQVLLQTQKLVQLTYKPHVNVMEIGFNAGHSTETLLTHNDTLYLTTFDLEIHDYTKVGKEYIDQTFPNRHNLILGDSTKTIPQILIENPNLKFDLIFIDGGHDYNIAKQELENCKNLSNSDTCSTKNFIANWTKGQTKTWLEHLSSHKIIKLGREEYSYGHGMV